MILLSGPPLLPPSVRPGRHSSVPGVSPRGLAKEGGNTVAIPRLLTAWRTADGGDAGTGGPAHKPSTGSAQTRISRPIPATAFDRGVRTAFSLSSATATLYPPERPAGSGTGGGEITESKASPAVSDPKYSQSYGEVCTVYAAESAAAPAAHVKRFEVYAPDEAALPTARRVARLLLTLYGEVRSRLRLDHSLGDGTIHVWLTRQPGQGLSSDVGGEQF